MLALLTTYYLVAYILIPGVLFRFFAGIQNVRLKHFQRTRSQEATFSVAVALLPFALALLGAWNCPVMKDWPFPIPEGTEAERRADYKQVARALLSNDPSRFLAAENSSRPVAGNDTQRESAAPSAVDPQVSLAATEAVWPALTRVGRRQARFLCWYFVFIAGEGLLFGYLANNYGNWQEAEKDGIRARLLHAYTRVARKVLLPSISEWHMLLTDFNLKSRDDLFVATDILQTDGNLYKGRVENYFLDAEGKLTGILLKDVYRFDRKSFDKAREGTADGIDYPSDDFWRLVPSANFYIGADKISNLNIRFAPRDDSALLDLASTALEKEDIAFEDLALTVQAGEETSPDEAGRPDLYS